MSKNETIQIRDNRERGWFWVHNTIIDEYNLEPYDLAVYVVLARYANTDGKCWPSLTTIAEKTHMSARRVIEATQTLEKVGLITITHMKKKSGENYPNLYTLLQPKNGGVVNYGDKGSEPDSLGVVNYGNTKNTYVEKDIKEKDIALQNATRLENQSSSDVLQSPDKITQQANTPAVSFNPTCDECAGALVNTNPTCANLCEQPQPVITSPNADWDILVAQIDKNKPTETISYKHQTQ